MTEYKIQTKQYGPSWYRFWIATVLNDSWANYEDWQIKRCGRTRRSALVKAEAKLIRMHRRREAHQELTYTFEVEI